ncbi:MAG: VOC family protein [Planctomycetota bacterium]
MPHLDHLAVFCSVDAPEAAALLALGLAIDVRRQHAGQGTANACIGFADGYLELLWLHDEQAARDPMVKPLGLSERARWRATGASPFAIALRPAAPAEPPPFPSWDYRPTFLPAGMRLAMACNSGVLGEPLLFQLDRPFVPLGGSHRLANRRLVTATVTIRDLAPMSLLHEVAVPGLVLRDGNEPLLELEFDAARATADLRPGLPLVLRW